MEELELIMIADALGLYKGREKWRDHLIREATEKHFRDMNALRAVLSEETGKADE